MASPGERTVLLRQRQELKEEMARNWAKFLELEQKLLDAPATNAGYLFPSRRRGLDTAETKPGLPSWTDPHGPLFGPARALADEQPTTMGTADRMPSSRYLTSSARSTDENVARIPRPAAATGAAQRRATTVNIPEEPCKSPPPPPHHNPRRDSSESSRGVTFACLSWAAIAGRFSCLSIDGKGNNRMPARFGDLTKHILRHHRQTPPVPPTSAPKALGPAEPSTKERKPRPDKSGIRNDPETQMRELVWAIHILRHQPEPLVNVIGAVQPSTQPSIEASIGFPLGTVRVAQQKSALGLERNLPTFGSSPRVACPISITPSSRHVETSRATRPPDIHLLNDSGIVDPSPAGLHRVTFTGGTTAFQQPDGTWRYQTEQINPSTDLDLDPGLTSHTTGAPFKVLWRLELAVASDPLFDDKTTITCTPEGRIRSTCPVCLSPVTQQIVIPLISAIEDEPWISAKSLTPQLDGNSDFSSFAKATTRNTSSPPHDNPGPTQSSRWSLPDIWTVVLCVSRLIFGGIAGATQARSTGGLKLLVMVQ